MLENVPATPLGDMFREHWSAPREVVHQLG